MSIWLLLGLWTIGAFFISTLPTIRATEAYIVAQTHYHVGLIKFVSTVLIFLFWIGILVYLIVDKVFLSKQISRLDGYEQDFDNDFEKWLDAQLFDDDGYIMHYDYDPGTDTFLIGDQDMQEEMFRIRAKNIENQMDPNKRWSIGSDGNLKEDR